MASGARPRQRPKSAASPPWSSSRQGEIDFPLRRTYEAMVHCMDSGVGNISAALRARGMWATTLVVMSSDNGGREDAQFGGNNWPLRGMKFTDFEGGTRVAAFVSGGAVPGARRGTAERGLMHICDWYCTFAALAGVDPADAKARGGPVPPVDQLVERGLHPVGGQRPVGLPGPLEGPGRSYAPQSAA